MNADGTSPHAPHAVTITALNGIPEVSRSDDLVAALEAGLRNCGMRLADGDILVVSSKIVSKAMGLVADDPDQERVVAAEARYVVAERALKGRVTRIVRAAAGPIMAAAGVDGSNTGERGGWLLLPHDPDGVCRELHASLTRRHRVAVGVIVSDTAGRPWRMGQVDFALGAHGLQVFDDLRGGIDADGRSLAVTLRCVADEIAAAADLVKGKAKRVPAALVRGLGALVTNAQPGPGARDLLRTGADDWFGYGQVEAVRAALGIEPGGASARRVGIPAVTGDTRAQALARAVGVALHAVPGATADVGPQSITLGAESPYDLGRVTARLQAALWCDALVGTPSPPSADELSVAVAIGPVGRRPPPAFE